MSVIRVISVDDEPLARERVSELIRATAGLELVGEGRNGLEALDLITKLKPDLVFIDVEMPELSGFGVIAAIEGQRIPGVVFVTAFEGYALKAFDVGAIDYLHKPVTPKRFAAAVTRSRERLARATEADGHAIATDAARLERERGFRTRFVVSQGGTHQFVPVSLVEWVDVADNYLQLHIGDRIHLVRGTLNDLVDELDPAEFVRVNRSSLVRLNRIASTRARESGGFVIELVGGATLKSSRAHAARIREMLRSARSS